MAEDISDNVGRWKTIVADGTIPAAFKVTEGTVTSKGVIIVNYERAGAAPTRKSINIRRVALAFDLAGITNIVGAPLLRVRLC